MNIVSCTVLAFAIAMLPVIFFVIKEIKKYQKGK